MKTIKDLVEIGFERIGSWSLVQNNKIDFSVTDNKRKQIMYAFVLNSSGKSEIIYIGKTIKTITERLKGYKKPGSTQNTNIRLNTIIGTLLQETFNEVEIFIFKNDEPHLFHGYRINLAAGLEDILIKDFKPKYNLHGNIKIVDDVEVGEDQVVLLDLNKDQIDCNNYYFGHKEASIANLNGIINWGNVPVNYLPNIGDNITVFLGNLVINPNFTNGNQQGGWNPRINSVIIGNWLQQNNINVGDFFYFKICNNNTFYFYSNAQ